MWAHYRKTLIPIQLTILTVCGILFFAVKLPFPGVVFFFFIMQIGALLGAAWGARMKRRMDPDRLPLKR